MTLACSILLNSAKWKRQGLFAMCTGWRMTQAWMVAITAKKQVGGRLLAQSQLMGLAGR